MKTLAAHENTASRKTPQPFSGLRIIQDICEECSVHVVRATCFCCRIAADLGAEIAVTGHRLEELDASARAFLTGGHTFRQHRAGEMPQADAVIACAHYEDAGGCPVVRIGLLPADADPLPSSAFTLMAASGVLDIVGDPKREPLKLAGYQLDYATGLSAYTALAALLAGGKGGSAYVSFLDIGIWLNWKSLVVAHGGVAPPSRKGRNSEWLVLRCADGWIALVYRENDWAPVKRLIGNSLLDDPDLDIRANRRRRATFIADIAEEKFKTMTRREIVAFSKANRVPIGAVLSLDEVKDSAQYGDRNFFRTVDMADGPVTIPRLPVLWGGEAFSAAGKGETA